ncbi:ankyrin [Penicillium chermesinum]|nr:ankyrin [Penicillium chermesinum]
MDLLTAKEEESRKGDDDGETRADQIKLVENHLEAVLYWAVQNGKHELAEICVQKNPKLVYLDKGGASLLHIAAIGGNVNIMDRLLQKRLQDQDDLMTRLFEQNLLKTRPEHLKHKLPFAVKKVTPFHLAVRYSNLEMVESLLSWVDDEPKEEGTSPPAANFPLNIDQARPELTSVLKTILQMTDDGDTPISLAASGNTGTHRDIEEILWKRLYNSIQRNPWFFYDPSTPQAPLSPEAERVLELAAQFRKPTR